MTEQLWLIFQIFGGIVFLAFICGVIIYFAIMLYVLIREEIEEIREKRGKK